MHDLESLKAALVTQGYYPRLHGVANGEWSCELATDKLKVQPRGTGATAIAALMDAIEDRVRLEADPKYKAA